MKNIYLFIALSLTFISCNTESQETTDQGLNERTSVESNDFYEGDFVTEDYFRRSEGYDWVAVSISKLNEKLAEIDIRSRSDKKKPTCTYNAKAVISSKDTLVAEYEGKIIVFTLTDSSLKIDTKFESDNLILNYFCSGGGSIGGTYIKLKEELDRTQLDNKRFAKTLSLQGITFIIEANNTGSINDLSILSRGLKTKELSEFQKIEGTVSGAEIEDLNSDGWPEIVIYTQSAGSGSYGNVICFSVSNGDSAVRVGFPELSGEEMKKLGYMGHDEFAIVETALIRRFPIYREGDSNADPTGGIRQIQYRLKKDEGNKFVIDKILNY